MILVDTSIWIDHLRKPEVRLQELLLNDEVVTHPLVRLELALGSIANREPLLSDLALLPQELKRKLAAHDPFLTDVWQGKRIELIGNE